jgi:hypothetical protein
MSDYLNINTGQFPLHEGDIQLAHPNWTVDQELPSTFVKVEWQDQPALGENQTALVAPPIEVNGVWTRQWTIHDLTEEELQAQEKLRASIPLPGYLFDKESQTWYPANPLVKANNV